LTLVSEATRCGSLVLIISALSDRFYYREWAFPPVRFLYFNITRSLAVFYGSNRVDYYFTEGLPLLLTAALPFAVAGIYLQILGRISYGTPRVLYAQGGGILQTLAWATIFVTVSFSFISHKEVRFLYPTLPALHVISACPLAKFSRSPGRMRKGVMAVLISVNLLIGIYVTQVHQRGVVDVVHFLRSQHEVKLLGPSRAEGLGHGYPAAGARLNGTTTTIGFLMPCHSTPWRSHLVHSDIDAWALTCEPPLDVPLDRRHTYQDEADQFYSDPSAWLGTHMEHAKAGSMASAAHQSARERKDVRSGESGTPSQRWLGERAWPQNLVFFAALEPLMKRELEEGRVAKDYKECWRGFNSHWHDDWRRTGDVVVWCAD